MGQSLCVAFDVVICGLTNSTETIELWNMINNDALDFWTSNGHLDARND